MPTGLAALAARAYMMLPERLASRVLPGNVRYDPATLEVATAAEGPGARLLVAPVNFAGQGHAWARAVERYTPHARAVSLAYRHAQDGYGFATDVSLPAPAYALSRSWHRRQRAAILEGFTHVLAETGRPPAGAPYAGSPERHLVDLMEGGVRVAYLAHGTDVRVPSQHAAANPDSPFSTGDHAQWERQAVANIALVRELKIPAFVSTPDLFAFLPEATWLPVVVDAAHWASAMPVLRRERPVVVHAPSSGALKGSDLIDPELTAMHDAGVIEYRRIRGIPAEGMPEIYRDADIVLDQFRIGGYGVAACEAMAAGRIVVGHVSRDVRERVAEETGSALPVVESRGRDIGRVIRSILGDRDRYAGIAAAGRAFVADVHDGRRSAHALAGFLAS